MPVVDVEQPAAGTAEGALLGTRRRHGEARIGAEIGPGLLASVDVLEIDPGLVEEAPEADRRVLLCDLPQLLDLRRPARRHGLADVREDDVGRDPIELHVAAGGKEREAGLDLVDQVLPASAEKGAEAPVEAKLVAVAPDEVEDRAHRLPRGTPQPAPQLLEEQGRAVCRAQKEESVDDGHVDALVEEVD